MDPQPDFQQILRQQREWFFKKVRHESANERIKKLKAIRQWLWDHEDDLVDAMESDFHIPAFDGRLLNILATTLAINHTIRHLKSWMRPKRVGTPLALIGSSGYVISQPKGVCLIISPWNFPVLLLIDPLVSAIAAGNCVILKPSEYVPSTSALLGKMVKELFDPDEVTLITGGPDVSKALVQLSFDHIFFTGGTAVGSSVMQAAAKNLTSVTLELGGLNPVIVDETANIKEAALRISWGKWSNAGQACVSVNTVYVHRSVYDQFLTAVKSSLEKLYPGDPAENPDYGRIISENHVNRISHLVEETLKAGATLISGGKSDSGTRFFDPTILGNVPWNSLLVNQEIFGPVLGIASYENKADLVSHLNKLPVPLALYIFSQNNDQISWLIEHTRAGTTAINELVIQFAHNGLAFGGTGASGFGKAHGVWGFQAFSNERSVFKQRHGLTSLSLFMPPYTPFKEKLLKIATRWL